MPLELSLEEQELLADTFQRVRSRMSARERAAEIVVGGGFAAAVMVLWWIQPPHTFDLAPAGLCLLMVVLASRVRFDTPFGLHGRDAAGVCPIAVRDAGRDRPDSRPRGAGDRPPA